MDAREAIIEAFCNLPRERDNFKNLGEVAWEAAHLMSGNIRDNLILIRQAFEDSFTCREKSLPFTYCTHLARSLDGYVCGRHRWPGTQNYLADGLIINGHSKKCMRIMSL